MENKKFFGNRRHLNANVITVISDIEKKRIRERYGSKLGKKEFRKRARSLLITISRYEIVKEWVRVLLSGVAE